MGAQALSLAGSGDAWTLGGRCPGCGVLRSFGFRSYGDPLTAPAPRGELGGAAPSELISPRRWIDEIERLRPLVHEEPTSLGLDAWTASRDALRRLRMCINELKKFVPPDADEIPGATLPEDERADATARAHCYRAPWINALRETYLQIGARYIADLPRVEALDKAREAQDLSWMAERAARERDE